ncbi:MAG: type 1 pili tip component [Proteobacteria bacterium]|nr:type 1 pili tip component [Pseudomonadota bacterium]
MSFRELLQSWQERAAAPRTAASYAVYLPLDDAARLHALAQMFPGRTPEQLITELLGTALQELAAAIPYVAGTRVIARDDQGDPVYEDAGLTPRFIELSRRFRAQLRTVPAARPARASPGKGRRRARLPKGKR